MLYNPSGELATLYDCVLISNWQFGVGQTAEKHCERKVTVFEARRGFWVANFWTKYAKQPQTINQPNTKTTDVRLRFENGSAWERNSLSREWSERKTKCFQRGIKKRKTSTETETAYIIWRMKVKSDRMDGRKTNTTTTEENAYNNAMHIRMKNQQQQQQHYNGK